MWAMSADYESFEVQPYARASIVRYKEQWIGGFESDACAT